ncbi:hypothetical protein [Wolbachia endosymbiont (group A) of Icerya purchasi]|uniref:hypothetical protein n=1 Tax=Wolbachia endosymbiont (group A) of Icerya purchasi TaxID=2954019 RepID=UPI00222F4AEF|nr:hypothetical protein [Wolbachia endosymbiont (group A) of Icerya purchasi]
MYVSHFREWQPLGCKHEIKAGNTKPYNANSGLKENRKGRKQGKLSNYKKIDEVTHGRYNKTVLFGR